MFGPKNFDQIMSAFNKARNELNGLAERCANTIAGLREERDRINNEISETALEKAKAINASSKIAEFFEAAEIDPADIDEDDGDIDALAAAPPDEE